MTTKSQTENINLSIIRRILIETLVFLIIFFSVRYLIDLSSSTLVNIFFMMFGDMEFINNPLAINHQITTPIAIIKPYLACTLIVNALKIFLVKKLIDPCSGELYQYFGSIILFLAGYFMLFAN